MSASSSLPTKEKVSVAPKCKHFGSCGGCRMQSTDYMHEVAIKQATLTEYFQRIEWQGAIKMHPSPEPWYYRNKMEFSFQDVFPAPPKSEDYLLLGLKVRNRWDKVK